MLNENRAVSVEIANTITAKSSAISQLLPSHINPERYIKSAIAAIAKNPRLLQCTKSSILESVVQAATIGLEVGSALGEGYLVPYKDQCQFIPGYRGFISLARRSGEIVSISANVVHEKDEFVFELGIHPNVTHRLNLIDEDPGKVIAVYAGASLKDGGDQLVVMSHREIEAIRKRSRASGNGPWVTDWEEMAKKTAIRRLFKMLPVSTEQLSQALDLQARSEADFSEEALTALAADQVSADAANKAAADAAAKAAENESGTLPLEGSAA